MIARLTVLAALVLALSQLGVPAAEAQGQAAVRARVMVILASNTDGGTIQPELQNVPGLRAAPFDSFNTMRLLSSPTVTLQPGQAQTVDLPNGRRVRLELVASLPDGRHRVRVAINRPNQQDYLPAATAVISSGRPVFIAGQQFQGGTLVIGIQTT